MIKMSRYYLSDLISEYMYFGKSRDELVKEVKEITLDDLVVGVERATGLSFPYGTKVGLKILSPVDFYEQSIVSYIKMRGKEPPEEALLDFKDEILQTKQSWMLADSIENIIYFCEDNLHYWHKEPNSEVVKLVVKSHEIGHLLLTSLVPELLVKLREDLSEFREQSLMWLGESFADYSMFKFVEFSGLDLLIDDFRISKMKSSLFFRRFDYHVFGLLSSNNPLALARKEVESI